MSLNNWEEFVWKLLQSFDLEKRSQMLINIRFQDYLYKYRYLLHENMIYTLCKEIEILIRASDSD